MRITTGEVRHVAMLARVGMTDHDIEVMREQMSNILEQFEVLKQVDTESVEPTGHSANLLSVMRDDSVRASRPVEDILANAPNREDAFVRVKAVFED